MAVKEFYRILTPDGVLSVVDTYAHSDPRDDIGNNAVTRNYAYSLYYCLSCSMSVPGSEAFGDCIGVEKLADIIKQGGFDFDGHGHITELKPYGYTHLYCAKQS